MEELLFSSSGIIFFPWLLIQLMHPKSLFEWLSFLLALLPSLFFLHEESLKIVFVFVGSIPIFFVKPTIFQPLLMNREIFLPHNPLNYLIIWHCWSELHLFCFIFWGLGSITFFWINICLFRSIFFLFIMQLLFPFGKLDIHLIFFLGWEALIIGDNLLPFSHSLIEPFKIPLG